MPKLLDDWLYLEGSLSTACLLTPTSPPTRVSPPLKAPPDPGVTDSSSTGPLTCDDASFDWWSCVRNSWEVGVVRICRDGGDSTQEHQRRTVDSHHQQNHKTWVKATSISVADGMIKSHPMTSWRIRDSK